MGTDQQPRRSAAIALFVAGALVVAACGTRVPADRLYAAAKGRPAAQVPGTQAGAGAGTTADQATGTTTPLGDGTSVPSAGPGATGPVAGTVPAASGTGGAGTVASGGSPARCAAPRSTITIASVGEQSGLVGAAWFPGNQAVQAWVAAVNATGGVSCHPVRYILHDDGGDPSRHLQMVRQAVEQEHAVAFVYQDAGLAGSVATQYLEQKHIPVIGTEGGSPWAYTSPVYFPQMSSSDNLYVATIATAGYYAKSAGLKKLGNLGCLETTQCTRSAELAPANAPKYGMDFVYSGTGSLAQPDFTSQCQAAQQKGVQVLMLWFDVNGAQRVASSCARVNFHPQYIFCGCLASPLLASIPGLDGTAVALNTAPWFDSSNAVVAQLQGALARYAPGVKNQGIAMVGWAAAKLFEVAAKALPDAPTSADVLKGLWALRGDDLGGITQPLTFTQGRNAPGVTCYWIAQLDKGTWHSPNGGKRICA